MTSSIVFLDANTIIYALDSTSEVNDDAVGRIQRLLEANVTLCTSHHVIEEVLHITRRIGETDASKVVKEVAKIPGLVLVEPDAVLSFTERYAKLSDRLNIGVNDALLLQLMLDTGITQLLSYDKRFVRRAGDLGINVAV